MQAKRRFSRIWLLAAVSALLVGCGQKSANLQEGAVAPDRVLYENGLDYLKKNQFIKSRLAFQTLISTYPDSDFTASAYLAIADSYFNEGGTANLLQAESQYKDFILYFPTHEMADDAQMRVVAVNFKLMNSPDRDQTHTRKALDELKRFMDKYPDSELSPTAREALLEVEENAAQGIQGIANFYYKRNSFPAAENRYKEVLDTYPNYSRADEAFFRLGESLMQNGRTEEASVQFSRVVQGFPFSEYYEDAKQKLIQLEKPVPETDPDLARQREAILNRMREDDTSFFNAWGMLKDLFTGRVDLYEVAKRRAEQQAMSDAAGNGGSGAKKGAAKPKGSN